ncbi:CST complex subunit STN1 [Podila verticillata]|nr:CST complex subunit STN1 [Podila verticillata]
MELLPPFLWGMDPLFHVPLQLMICQIKKLIRIPDLDGIYRHHSHTVRTTEIMGMIQRVQRKTSSIVYALDDGTGVMQCIIWIPDEYKMIQDTSLVPGLKTFELGQVVRVTGCPGEYRGEIQLTVQPGDVSLCSDPNDETVFRLQALNMEKVYTNAVKLPPHIRDQATFEQASQSTRSAKDKPHPTKITLFNAIRDWVSNRKGEEFTFMELDDDPAIRDLAMTMASQESDHPVLESSRALRLVAGTVQDLIREGSIEVRDRENMVLGARAHPEALSQVEAEVVELDRETWIQQVSKQIIELDDTSDDD